MNKYVKYSLSLLVGIAVLAYLIYSVDAKATLKTLASIPTIPLLIVLILQAVQYLLWTFRWWLIVKKLSEVHFSEIMPIFLAGCLINQLTPGSKSGGQPLRAYYANKLNRKGFAANFATTMFDFLAGAFVSCTLILFAVIYLFFRFPETKFYWIFSILLTALLVVAIPIILCYALAKKSITAKKALLWMHSIPVFRKASFRKIEKKILGGIKKFYKYSIGFLTDWQLVLNQIAVEFTAYAVEFTKIYLLFTAVGINIPFVDVAVVSIISQVAGFVFFTPGGLGIVESSSVGLYYLFGISSEAALAVTLVNTALKYLVEFGIGYISLLYLQNKR